MTRPTLANLNAWIRATWPDLNVTMYKGAGYFYFVGDHEVPSIYVYAMNHMTMDEWKDYITSSVKDSQDYRYVPRNTTHI